MQTSSIGTSLAAHQPLVTVLTPTLNRCAMLADTLASVHLQDYPNIEHIVIDGGSTDGTVELLQRAEQRWGIRWLSSKDEGMYEALNRGLALARGSLVGWINSDDWLMPWTASVVVAEMTRRSYPTAVFGDYLAVAPADPAARIRVYGQFRRRGLASVDTLAQPTVFWPISFTRALGVLDTATYRQIADCEYWLRLSEAFPFVKVREFLAVGQDHPDAKRVALSREIEAEFAVLRRQYAVRFSVRTVERVVSALRWRCEWGALLMGRGWSRTRDGDAVAFPWDGRPLVRTMLAYGPQRKHPPNQGRASVARLIQRLEEAKAELESE